MTNNRTIEKIVRDVIRDRFGDVEIISIDARPDIDEDGDQVWYIHVVMEKAEMKRLNPEKSVGVIRHLLPKMEEAGDHGFPILSYIAKSELGKRSAEIG